MVFAHVSDGKREQDRLLHDRKWRLNNKMKKNFLNESNKIMVQNQATKNSNLDYIFIGNLYKIERPLMYSQQ